MTVQDHTHVRPWRAIDRRVSRKIRVGNVEVGGDAPITVQSMTNTLTADAAATTGSIRVRTNRSAASRPADRYTAAMRASAASALISVSVSATVAPLSAAGALEQV